MVDSFNMAGISNGSISNAIPYMCSNSFQIQIVTLMSVRIAYKYQTGLLKWNFAVHRIEKINLDCLYLQNKASFLFIIIINYTFARAVAHMVRASPSDMCRTECHRFHPLPPPVLFISNVYLVVYDFALIFHTPVLCVNPRLLKTDVRFFYDFLWSEGSESTSTYLLT